MSHRGRLTLVKSPLVNEKSGGHSQPIDSENGRNEMYMFETPEFQRHEEATSIELFYDLFFVANLTTFTSLHEINGGHTLSSYAGFFCILWFTWCQVSLFDVRYVSDGVLERCLRALQFGVMVGFAVVGPKLDPYAQKATTFQALSLILAASRFVLSIQYLIVLFHVKKYKKSQMPLALLVLSSFIAGLIYLGISFVFKEDHPSKVYAAWYILAVVEIGINIIISSSWKVVSFKGTHLVQRMSLLTLIILGEGIIIIFKSIGKIVKQENAYTSATVGNIIAAVVLIYFLYMLYFDWLNIHDHFGSIRQQIWTFLHFPFHLFLVLSLAGTSQVIIVRKLAEAVAILSDKFTSGFAKFNDDSVEYSIDDLVSTFNTTIQNIFVTYPPTFTSTITEVQDGLEQLRHATTNSTQDDALTDVLSTVINSIYESYGVELSEKDTANLTSAEQNEKYAHVFEVLFIYFFVTIGGTILLMNLLNYLSISHKSSPRLSLGSWLRLAFNTIIGVALCAVAGIARTTGAMNYLVSPWVLPTIAIALFSILVVNNIRSATPHNTTAHDLGGAHVSYHPAGEEMQPMVHNVNGAMGYTTPSQPYQPYGEGRNDRS
ncbi:hypothetical protein LSUB1_G000922 [Lachnellula subtilissima]|uniref:Low temperature requirement protein A n=1 Tax=Lachnellula subtilissima TaxID=602034 RepID=A0A8H8RWI8_9HELO|nr:hypothetical protein LSUB1_G000922 [Lachnellula subtilissima]